MQRVIAGRYGTRGSPDSRDLARCLARDGQAATAVEGALQLAWTDGDGGPRPGTAGTLCLLDGRLTNLPECRRALSLPQSGADETTLALAYERHGEELLSLLRGEFVLVFWDRSRQRGLIARDQIGFRPLFVCERDGGLIFGSEVRNLLDLLPRRPEPDTVTVTQWLAGTPQSPAATLYSGVASLPAAHLLALEGERWVRRRYWSPRYVDPGALSQPEAAVKLRAEMAAAVERALVEAERPGVLLSGGFDSASVAGLAKRRSGGLTAYSAVFPAEPSADESDRIAANRDGIGLHGVEARIRGGSALAGGLEFQATWQLPSVSPNWFLWGSLLRRARADGVDTLLDGEGGDEMLGCAPYLLADLLRAGRLIAMLRNARRIPGMGAHPRPRWIWRAVARYGARGALPRALHEPLRRARGRTSHAARWLRPELAQLHEAAHDPWAWKTVAGPRWWAALSQQLTVTNEGMQVHDQLRREAALAGLRFGHPLRDPGLLELVLALPPGLMFDAELDRPLARAAMADVVPERTRLDDHKVHFTALLESALDGPDLPVVRGLLEEPRAELGAYVRLDLVRSELLNPSATASRPAGWALDLWRVITLECWLRSQATGDLPERLGHRIDARAGAYDFVDVGGEDA